MGATIPGQFLAPRHDPQGRRPGAADLPGMAPDTRCDDDPADALRQVVRYLRFLGCPRDSVEDLGQEAMLLGCRRWPAGAPLPWLLVTARNLHRQHLRALGRRREIVDADRLHELWQRHVEDGGDALRAALRSCLQGLPERSRRVLELRYGEDADRGSIAAALGMGEEGVKSLLMRVRAAVGECVRRRLRHDDE